MFSWYWREKERGYDPQAKELSLKHQNQVETFFAVFYFKFCKITLLSQVPTNSEFCWKSGAAKLQPWALNLPKEI